MRVSMPTPVRLSLAIAVVLVSARGLAAAQPAPLPVTMDRVSGESRLGVELGLVRVDDTALSDDFFAARFEVSGHFVTPRGIGGYGSLVGTMAFSDADDEAGVQGLELGGLYRLQGRGAAWWLRFGLLLDTADDDQGFITNLLTMPARLTDLAKVAPDATWLRLSTTPIVRSGNLVFRADLGLDVPIDDGPGDADPLARVNLGLGVAAGQAAILFELCSLADLDEDEGDDDLLHTLALSARFLTGPTEPYITLGLPLDDSLRDAFPFFILAGLSARL